MDLTPLVSSLTTYHTTTPQHRASISRTERNLDVKHRILQLRMNATTPPRRRRIKPRGTRRPVRPIQRLAEIAAGARAQQVGVVCGRTDGDGLGGAAEHVAQIVRLLCSG